MSLFLFLWCLLGSAFAMEPGAFASLRAQVEDASFSSDKLSVVRTAASTNTFSAEQVAALLEDMSFGSDKLKALELLAPRIDDRRNQHLILDSFSFSSEKSEASEVLARFATAAPPPPRPAPHRTDGRPLPPRPDERPTFTPCSWDASLPPLEVDFTSRWTDAEVDSLAASIDKASFSKDQKNLLRTALAGRAEGFSGPQVRRLLAPFGFNSDMVEAVQIVDDHLLGMTAAEVSAILGDFSFSKDKLAVLRALKDTITDPEHKHTILDAMTFSSDKEEAARILADVKPRSFLYGTVHSQSVVFVVDVSGSMNATFRTNQGVSWTRLDFVRCELERVLTTQFAPGARFNIVLFGRDVRPWQRGLVDASPDNVRDAIDFLRSSRPYGATNVHGALDLAMRMGGDTIYFLTDGKPTEGRVQDPRGILADVSAWRGDNTRIHSIAFLMGRHDGDDKAASRALMRDLAATSGGIYRALE